MQYLLDGRRDTDFLSGHLMKRNKEQLRKPLQLQKECNNAECRLTRTTSLLGSMLLGVLMALL